MRSATPHGLGTSLTSGAAVFNSHRSGALRRATWLAPIFGALLVACQTLVPTSAVAAGGKHAAFIIDGNTGAVISSSNADEPRYPASLTKMMTLYVVFDLIEQGRLNYKTSIKISEAAASVPPTKLGLKEGSEIALIDAIKALITKSANDMAVAIAEHIAGSEEKFANLMTQRARQIGMTATTFKNAHGLPNDAQVTTARDMVTLGLRLHDDFPKHFALFSTREFRHGGELHRNHNTMLNHYDGTEGIKTGYTRASGYNLVASVKRGTKHVVGAVFGGSTAGQRNQTMRTLLNIALVKSSPVKTRATTVAVAALRPSRVPQPAVRPSAVAVAVPPVASENAKLAVLNSPTKQVFQPSLVEPPMLVPGQTRTQADAGAGAPLDAVTSSATPPNTAVEIARVRPVLVAPRAARQAPIAQAPSAADEPLQRAASTAPLTAPVTASALAPGTTFAKPSAAVALPPLVAPSEPVAAVGRARVAVAPIPPVASPGMTTIQRGAGPSSLQAQAESLARGAAPPEPPLSARLAASSQGERPTAAFRLNGPRIESTGSSGGGAGGGGAGGSVAGGVHVQIGAFSSEAEASRHLAAVSGKASDLLAGGRPLTLAAQTNGRSIYRARFAGFDATRAGAVCTELRRRQIDCLVTKSE
jgi:D-alanyl-D-alanine carboxypeptidase